MKKKTKRSVSYFFKVTESTEGFKSVKEDDEEMADEEEKDQIQE